MYTWKIFERLTEDFTAIFFPAIIPVADFCDILFVAFGANYSSI